MAQFEDLEIFERSSIMSPLLKCSCGAGLEPTPQGMQRYFCTDPNTSRLICHACAQAVPIFNFTNATRARSAAPVKALKVLLKDVFWDCPGCHLQIAPASQWFKHQADLCEQRLLSLPWTNQVQVRAKDLLSANCRFQGFISVQDCPISLNIPVKYLLSRISSQWQPLLCLEASHDVSPSQFWLMTKLEQDDVQVAICFNGETRCQSWKIQLGQDPIKQSCLVNSMLKPFNDKCKISLDKQALLEQEDSMLELSILDNAGDKEKPASALDSLHDSLNEAWNYFDFLHCAGCGAVPTSRSTPEKKKRYACLASSNYLCVDCLEIDPCQCNTTPSDLVDALLQVLLDEAECMPKFQQIY